MKERKNYSVFSKYCFIFFSKI